MDLKLTNESKEVKAHVQVTGSKSESNRLLILQALFQNIQIRNLSNSDDTRVLQKALTIDEEVIDIHHAGTAMRFLTAWFAGREGREVVLTGSDRMKERPIKILVDALISLGADIQYVEQGGFPPLKIKGRKLTANRVKVQANISSQYISALMLIAPGLPNGLTVELEGKVTSVPYIEMTLKLMKQCAIEGSFENNEIRIPAVETIEPVMQTVESDWSSASYFYSIAALSNRADLTLESYKKDSFQGDRVIAEIFKELGVETTFLEGKIRLLKKDLQLPEVLRLDLANAPDLAQTIAVTCFGLGIGCELSGLYTLRIKETDRLEALKNEIEKLGGRVQITADTLTLERSAVINPNVQIATYNDHRMALAFAPLAMKTPIEIMNADVVSKSFPGYWRDLSDLGFSVE